MNSSFSLHASLHVADTTQKLRRREHNTSLVRSETQSQWSSQRISAMRSCSNHESLKSLQIIPNTSESKAEMQTASVEHIPDRKNLDTQLHDQSVHENITSVVNNITNESVGPLSTSQSPHSRSVSLEFYMFSSTSYLSRMS